MKIKVKTYGIPALELFFIGNTEISFSGYTFGELIQALSLKYGQILKDQLLEPNGELQQAIQVRVNRKLVPRCNLYTQKLKEGDEIILMYFIGGG